MSQISLPHYRDWLEFRNFVGIKFSYCLFVRAYSKLRPNKKISVFRVKGLKILVRVGTHNLIKNLE